MSKCLVTGGAGFIGSNLVDELINCGNDVVIIDNLSTGKKEYINTLAKFYKVDICSDAIEKIFKDEKFDYIFHLAAQIDIKTSVENPIFDNKINVLGSLNIFKNSVKNKVKKVIFISTGGALYGDCSKPATENTLINPVSPYAINKYSAERHLILQNELYNMDYIILRLANIYGPKQYKGGECGVIGIFTSNSINKKDSILFGNGSKTRDYVFVNDVTRACILSLKNKITGVFNIGTGIETNNLKIIKIIENINGENFNFKYADDKPGEVSRSFLNYQKAKKVLEWQPKTKLEDGIKITLDWLRKK